MPFWLTLTAQAVYYNLLRLKLKSTVKSMESIWSWLMLAAVACRQGAAKPIGSSDEDPVKANLD